jgi:hypothetical protein
VHPMCDRKDEFGDNLDWLIILGLTGLEVSLLVRVPEGPAGMSLYSWDDDNGAEARS